MYVHSVDTPPLRPRSQRIQNKLSGIPTVSESPLSTPEFAAEEYKQKIRNTEGKKQYFCFC